jgi:hypothetical protein
MSTTPEEQAVVERVGILAQAIANAGEFGGPPEPGDYEIARHVLRLLDEVQAAPEYVVATEIVNGTPAVWDASVPPGGYVCAECGQPVETEGCPEHSIGGWSEIARDHHDLMLREEGESFRRPSRPTAKDVIATVLRLGGPIAVDPAFVDDVAQALIDDLAKNGYTITETRGLGL